MESLTVRAARRLALARAGLLKPEWTGFPRAARGTTKRARAAAHQVIERFGYLQLDTVSIAGARSHTIVLLSRIEGMDPALGEALLEPGAPLFEYWGHEASWIPIELYPAFEFRRREFKHHPWWGNIVGKNRGVARRLRKRIREGGPIRSADMEGRGSRGWWDLKVAKKVAAALWSSGELAIAERKNFLRSYDLGERVIPAAWIERRVSSDAAMETLLLKALEGHGWATTRTLVQTWRLIGRGKETAATLARLVRQGKVVPCVLENAHTRGTPGWIRPEDLGLAAKLDRVRPDKGRGVLLSPFDPLLWDRARVKQLFDFDQILEIFKPAAQRDYGYYCMPVLAGERLVSRMDFKADRKAGVLRVLSTHFEGADKARPATPADGEATRTALERYAAALQLEPAGRSLKAFTSTKRPSTRRGDGVRRKTR